MHQWFKLAIFSPWSFLRYNGEITERIYSLFQIMNVVIVIFIIIIIIVIVIVVVFIVILWYYSSIQTHLCTATVLVFKMVFLKSGFNPSFIFFKNKVFFKHHWASHKYCSFLFCKYWWWRSKRYMRNQYFG